MTSNGGDSEIVAFVTATVKRLNELKNRLKTAGFTFKDNDIDHIDQIIESLQDLDISRIRSMETFETETIKASALRHKLRRYPREINDEIQGAVKAARGLNEDTINRLRAQLQKILDSIAKLTASFEDFDAKNAVLIPQRDEVKMQHEEVIADLNQRLSQKAGQQIDLNETRDHVRNCNKRIIDLEEEIVQLKEDLVQERAAARQEKKMLNKETTQTIDEYTSQRERNSEKKQVLDGLQHEVSEVEMRMADLQKQISGLEAKVRELLREDEKLQNDLERQVDENERLKLKGLCFREEKEKLAEEFEANRIAIEEKIKEVENSVDIQEKKRKKLEEKKAEMQEDVEAALKIREADAKKVKELNDILQKSKSDLAARAEDCGRLQQEIGEMEERMISIEETHKSTVVMLNKQIAEHRDQLSRERQERIEMQADKDVLQKEIDAFRQQHNKFIKETNKLINEGKSEHSKLTKEQQDLTKGIKDSISLAERLDQQLNDARLAYTEMQDNLKGQVGKLKTEMDTMAAEAKAKEEEIESRLPDFREFEAFFNRSNAEYDELKKKVVKMKNEKTSLEESVTRTKKEIARQEKPLNDLRAELTRKQEQAKQQLEEHAEERMTKERNIYVLGCKVKTATEENARFDQGNDLLEKAIRKTTDEWRVALKIKAKMPQIVEREKTTLAKGWADDSDLRAKSVADDDVLMQELGSLLERTDDRERLLSSVSRRLQDELEGLTEFLENIGSRRRAGAKTERGGEPNRRILLQARAIRMGLGAIHGVAQANSPIEKRLPQSSRT